MRKFLAEKFINEKPPYSLTSFIANESLYRDFKSDFIVYPSAKTFTTYTNFAFHPNTVHENLQLKKVLKFKVLEKSAYQIVIGYMAVGELMNGFMTWGNPNTDNIKDFNFEENSKFYQTPI